MWGLFGGGVEGDETLVEAVMREAYEELEYRLRDPRYIEVGEREENGVLLETHVFAEEYDGSPLVLHEGQAYGWFTIDEAIMLPMNDKRRESLKRIKDKIF
jgi:8-oxo-dGTP pyrophosphatase MutT (NUDIX family)